jgi:hypothetical protein
VFDTPSGTFYGIHAAMPWPVRTEPTREAIAAFFRQRPGDALIDMSAIEITAKEEERIDSEYKRQRGAHPGQLAWLVPLARPRAILKTRGTKGRKK